MMVLAADAGMLMVGDRCRASGDPGGGCAHKWRCCFEPVSVVIYSYSSINLHWE